jgi:hypothetical protein
MKASDTPRLQKSDVELCTHRLCRDDFVLTDCDASRVLEVLFCELADFGRPGGGEPESCQPVSAGRQTVPTFRAAHIRT